MQNEVFTRLVWIVLFTSALGYASYLFFGSIVNAQTDPPMVVDVYDYVDTAAGTHRLSGIIMVPTPCHSIMVKAKEMERGKYNIAFSTYGDERGCASNPTPRAWRVVFNAPLVGVEYTANLDLVPIDFNIVSEAHS